MTTVPPEYEHRFDLFGTRVRVLIDADDAYDPGLSALRVHARMRKLHRALSRFETDSELSQVNAGAGSHVAASTVTLDAIAAAVGAAHRSGGLVDPTILADLERAGYAASRVGQEPAGLAAALATAPARRPAGPRPAAEWNAIAIDPVASTVRLPPGVRVDLGGTAKGLAVDLAADLLARHAGFAIDAGGDIRIGGTERRPRIVHIEHPLHDGPAHSVTIADGAVATSGLRTRVWETADGYAHHLIDPARGKPAWTGVFQATALAPSALEAEVLAKTALLSGPARGRTVLARHGGALILDSGECLVIGERLAHEPVLSR